MLSWHYGRTDKKRKIKRQLEQAKTFRKVLTQFIIKKNQIFEILMILKMILHKEG